MAFESDERKWVGLSFAEEEEAKELEDLIKERMKSSPSKQQRKSTILTSIFRRGKSKKEESQNAEEDDSVLRAEEIGDPSNFRHLSHIGFNANTGAFDINNIPPEWRKMFAEAGVTQAQLQDRGTANFIAKFVQEETTKKKGPPPPVPAKKGPPPPPPARKPKQQLGETTQASQESRLPPIDPGRANLMSSIREANVSLRPVQSPSSSSSTAMQEEPGDLMAQMLAKALAERNKRLAHSDSDSGGSDGAW